MKKTAFLMAVLMVLSSVCAFAASEPEVMYYDEGFASTATNGAPSGFVITGKAYIAKVVSGGSDKVLILKNGSKKLSASTSFKTESDIYYVQTRVKLDDINTKKTVALMVDGKNKLAAVSFNKNGNIENKDGYKIGRAETGKWFDIGFKADAISGKADIYINGKSIQDRIDLGGSRITGVTFESEGNEKGSCWYVDYIRAYKADAIMAYDAIRYTTNPEVLPDDTLDLPPEIKIQSQQMLGYDFEEEAVGSVPDGFWTKNAPYIDERKDGEGKAFKIARTDVSVAGENYIDILVNASMENATIEADFYNPIKGNTVKLFTLRDKPGNFCTLLNLYTDGTVKTASGVTVAKGVNKKWVNIAVTLDFSMRTYSVYVDRKLAAENLDIPNTNTEDYIQLVRFEVSKGANKEELWVDNMYVYTGNELQDFSEQQKQFRLEQKLAEEEEERLNGPKGDPVPAVVDSSYFADIKEDVYTNPSKHLGGYDGARNVFKDAFCVVARNNNVMIGGKKYAAPHSILYEDMVMLAPVRMLGAAYGFEIGWDSATGEITMGDDIRFKNGDMSFEYKGKTVELSVPVTVKDGVSYLELRPFAEKVINSYMYQSGLGIAIISAEKLGYQSAQTALRYIVCDRPNAATIYQTLTERYPDFAHPRALFTDGEFDRAIAVAASDVNAAKWNETVMKSAKSLLSAELPKFGYDSAGLRVQNLTSPGEVLTLYWAYKQTGDEAYVKRAIDEALACCEYPTWGADSHFLEVGETSASMGLVFDLFYDKLTQEQRDTIAGKILEYGLKPASIRYYGENPYGGLDWPVNPNNWNIVCNKGIIIGALAICDEYDTELCLDVLEKAIQSIEAMMSTYAPEGAWGEGPAYWEYTVSNNVLAIKALECALGSDYGISEIPGFLETGYYPFQISGNAGAYAYHDSSRVFKLNGSAQIFYIAKKANDPSLAGLQLYTMNKNGEAGGITHLMYYDPAYVAEAAGLGVDCLYTSSQVATVRSDWGANAVWMGIHAGANDVAHGHVDLGSFEYEADGVRFASEMGKDDYNLPGYWNTAVRNIYVQRAEGHNVYVINPDIGAGQEVRAKSAITQVAAKPQGSIYTIDMTSAYVKNVEKAIRGFKLSEHRRVFTVQDEIKPLGNDEYYWFWHTIADININEDGKSVKLVNGSRAVDLYFDSNVEFVIEKGLSLPLPTSPVVEGQLGNLKTTINKITVRFKSEAGVPITFRATAVPSGCSIVPDSELMPISEWTIPDGEFELEYDKPESILVGGEAIAEYNSEMTEYSVSLYKVPEQMPEISVTGCDNCEIIQPTFENPTAVIKIPSTNDPDFYTTYYVTVNISTGLDKPASSKLKVSNVEASAIPEKENVPPNMLDGNLNTRWSAEGIQWAEFDLGETKSVSGLGIAIYSGLARSHSFEILVSEDGENYTSIVKAKTSKLTTGVEYIEFNPVSARYVKLNNFGNSANAWNSITEVEIYGK